MREDDEDDDKMPASVSELDGSAFDVNDDDEDATKTTAEAMSELWRVRLEKRMVIDDD